MSLVLLLPRSLPPDLSPPTSRSLLHRPIYAALLTKRKLRFSPSRCNSGDVGGEPLLGGKDALLPEMVDALLRKEENLPLLEGIKDASRRVERAREALKDIEQQEAQLLKAKAYMLQLQDREAQIAESQKELLEARAMVEEAQRSLSSNIGDSNAVIDSNRGSNDIERLESVKAALISSVAGTLAGLPISIYQATSATQLTVHIAIILISCALFGVTFRYAIRRDLDNIQLKTGASAAFGFVKGMSALEYEKVLDFNIDNLIATATDGAILVSENIFVFLFSAIALDFCFKTRLLSPFPVIK